MSYASEVKKELTALTVHKANAKAELMALIRMNGGALGISNHQFILNVQSENPAIARRMYSLLSQFYGITGELSVRKKMKLKKNNLYILRVSERVTELLDDLGILMVLKL